MNSSSSDAQLTRAPYPPPGLSDGAWTMARPSPSTRRSRQDDDANQATPIQRMHRLLRGRYAIAFTLAALLATALAAAGYLLPKPVYKSNGIIEIKPNIASLTDTATVMPLYTQYVEQQVQVMGTERVITSAMESDEWKPFSNGMSPKAMKDFVDHLDVEYVRGTFAIRVAYTDPDPSRAQAAVKSVIRAYLQTSADVETQDLRNKLQLVTNTRDALARTKNDLERKRVDAARQYGTTDLSELHNARVKQMITLESQLTQANIQFESYKAALNGGTNAATQPTAAMNAKLEMTYSQIAKADPRMQTYLAQRDVKADEVDRMTRTYGPKHPHVIRAQEELADQDARIAAYADAFRAENSGLQAGADGRSTAVTPQMVQQAKQNRDFLAEQVQKQNQLAIDVGNKRVEIQQIDNDIKDAEEKLADQSKKLDELNVQLAMSGRINPVSMGDRPFAPSTDNRRKFAILGFLGGGVLPFVGLMLVGLTDKRYRYSDDTGADLSGIPLLGILPNLPDLLTDPQQAAIAAHCVHQIRTLLQVGVRTQDRHVYAITSASPGDGKTSLTLALGLSFAASGARTLLIDCDLVGGSLTRRLGVNAPEGMLEALNSRSPLDYVRDTDIANLSILPVGTGTMLPAGSFSPAGLRRLIAEARKSFDIVLIDTGPILGSIEAPPVAATADATILCVSRGQHRPAVERSMHHLIAIGAKIAGVVFNRAETRDFERSVSRFSQRSLRPAPSDYASNGNGNLRLPGTAAANGNGKSRPDSAPAVASSAIDPVTRAVQSDFKSDLQ